MYLTGYLLGRTLAMEWFACGCRSEPDVRSGVLDPAEVNAVREKFKTNHK